MLYDNGQLLSLYSHAFQLTRNPFYKNLVTEIAAFIERDLTSPQGGFYSSLNAETKDGEGAFYSWSFHELKKILGEESATLSAAYFNVSVPGNWKPNKNLLYASGIPDDFARIKNLNAEDFNIRLSKAKSTLLSERNKRTKPETDEKILASWNALTLKGYTDAYIALQEESYLRNALMNAKFIEKYMLAADGQLWRNFNAGKASIPGFLDDYAFVARAFISLYEVTFDKHWLLIAQRVAEYALNNFHDSKSGMFYYTSATSEKLVVRKIELSENALPSSNGVMAEVLYRLSVYFENEEYFKKASHMVSVVCGPVRSNSVYYSGWWHLAGNIAHGTREIVVMGKDAIKINLALQKNYLPTCLFMGSTEEEDLPLLLNKMPENETLIYVCTNKTCKLPVREVDQALEQLGQTPSP
jgi:uncharacterized protein YyaL (SSP411 family)